MKKSHNSIRVAFIPKSLVTRRLIAYLLALLTFIQPVALFVLSFPTIVSVPYAAGRFGTLQAFAFPMAPPGAIYYSDDLVRDLLNPALAVSASALGVLAAKRLLILAPRLIQAAQQAGFAFQQSRLALAPATRGLY